MPTLAEFPITKRWPPRNPDAIQLYSLATPNGVKISIALEELGLPYDAHLVDFATNDQTSPEFLSLNPNNKIPAIIDPHGPDGQPLALFESGAILIYLAEKAGKLLPQANRFQVLQWLMFQMGGVGPMLGQAHHFRIYAPEKIEYGINRYTNEAKRLYGVMDKQLQSHDWIAGDEYSVADMAIFPWLRSWQNQGIDWADYPHLKIWFDRIAERPAVQKAVQVLADARKPLLDNKAKKALFGAAQYKKR